jgi:hypothetical protein
MYIYKNYIYINVYKDIKIAELEESDAESGDPACDSNTHTDFLAVHSKQ